MRIIREEESMSELLAEVHGVECFEEMLEYVCELEDWEPLYDVRLLGYKWGYSKEAVAYAIDLLKDDGRVAVKWDPEIRKEMVYTYGTPEVERQLSADINWFNRL